MSDRTKSSRIFIREYKEGRGRALVKLDGANLKVEENTRDCEVDEDEKSWISSFKMRKTYKG